MATLFHGRLLVACTVKTNSSLLTARIFIDYESVHSNCLNAKPDLRFQNSSHSFCRLFLRNRLTFPVVSENFDPEEMVARFRERAAAVKRRGLPPVEGAERKAFMLQAQTDFMDFAIIGDANARLEGTKLILEIDLAKNE